MLENILKKNEILKIIQERKLIFPLGKKEVTSKYLTHLLFFLEEERRISKEEFISDFSRIFQCDENDLLTLVKDPYSLVNLYLYRAISEAVRELCNYNEDNFYQRIPERIFLDHQYRIIGASRFFGLDDVLSRMEKQNENWNLVTEAKSEKIGRGKMLIRRKTKKEYLSLMFSNFGEELSRRMLEWDCIFTRASYQTVFRLFGDKAASLKEESCEIFQPWCLYEINFTPTSRLKVVHGAMITLLSYLFPPLRQLIKEYDGLKTEIFTRDRDIYQATETIRELRERDREQSKALLEYLQKLQSLGLSSLKHFQINELISLKSMIEMEVIKCLELWLKENPQEKQILGLDGEVTRNVLFRQLYQKRDSFDHLEERLRKKKPFPLYFLLNIFIETGNILGSTISAFDEQKRGIETVFSEVNLKESAVKGIKEAEEIYGTRIGRYDCNSEIDLIKGNESIFQTLFRDLTLNSLRAGARNIRIQIKPILTNEEFYPLYISFEDDGEGISNEQMEKLNLFFKDEYSGPVSTRADGSGGIGSATLREIAKLYSGRVVYSKKDEGGVKVELFLRRRELI